MSAKEKLASLWERLKGKGPAAAVAVSLNLGEARENKPYMLEAGGLIVESCQGNLYARINGPNGDAINLRYVRRILYPFSSLYLTNSVQTGCSARLLLLPEAMDALPGLVFEPREKYKELASATGKAGNTVTFFTVPSGSEWLAAMVYIHLETAWDVGARYPWFWLKTLDCLAYERRSASSIDTGQIMVTRWLRDFLQLTETEMIPGSLYYCGYMPTVTLPATSEIRVGIYGGFQADTYTVKVHGEEIGI